MPNWAPTPPRPCARCSPARPTRALPDWISESELDHYAAEFGRTGFTGGLNWYRNFDRNWATTEHVPARMIGVPALFIGGRDDPTLAFTRTDRAREVVDRPLPRGVRSTAPATGCNRTVPTTSTAFCWSSWYCKDWSHW